MDKPFLTASEYYNQVWIWPPTYENTYMKHSPTQLYMASGHDGSSPRVTLQREEDSGLYMSKDSLWLQLDKTHGLWFSGDSFYCRCGDKGFAYYDGAIHNTNFI